MSTSASSSSSFAEAVQATEDAPLVTDAPAADEAVVDADAPPWPFLETSTSGVPVVATVRREERHAVLTVTGVETVLSQHDAQVLWRELNVALAVL